MAPEYDREIWGNKPPWERPVWARFLRVSRGAETQEEFLKRLAKFGRRMSAPYLSELERGSKPINADWQAVFRSFFGKGPEDWDDPWERSQESNVPGDLSAAVAAQTVAIEAQTAVLRQVLALLTGPAVTGLGRLLAGLGDIEPSLTETDAEVEADPQAGVAEGGVPVGQLP